MRCAPNPPLPGASGRRASPPWAVVVIAAGGLTAAAQTVPPPAAGPTDEPAIVLSPFTVDTTRDRGYQAENTLSGSRLNSSLNDTPASVSVFTKEFLQDIGTTDLAELMEYSVNAQLNFSDTTSATQANSYVNAISLVKRIDIRGIPSSQALDYFRSITPDDSYRIGRYDESRGPNGILFGISDVGGLINQTSKRAQTARNRGELKYGFGTEHRNRVEFDVNRILLRDRLAATVAAVHQENGGWQTHDFQDKDRAYGTVFFRPVPSLTVNVMGELGREKRAVVVPFTPGDEVLAWYDNREARGLGTVTFAPLNVNPTAAQQQVGVTGRNANFTGAGVKRVTFISNDATVFNAAGTYLSGSYNNVAVRAPDGTPGVTGDELRMNDPGLVPYEVNAGGPGMFRRQDLRNWTFLADWQVVKNLFVNLGYDYQSTHTNVWFVNNGAPILRGDPNTTLGVRGPANPYVGRLYFDANWKQDYHNARHEDTRLSLSYLFDTRRLGSHRIAAMASHVLETDLRVGTWQALAGAPFSPDPENASNRLTTRYYVEEGNPESFTLGDWRQVPRTVSVDGATYDVTWVNQPLTNQNSYAVQKVDTKLIVTQSHFFNRRLVATLGYREDEAKITSFGFAVHPTLKMNVIDRDPAKALVNRTRGITRTQGVVFHAWRGLSLVANASTSIGLPDFTRKVFPDGRVPDPARGRGEDFGVSVQLFERKVTAKAVYFTTRQEGDVSAGGVTFSDANLRVTGAFSGVLAGPGGPITAAEWATRLAAFNPGANGVIFDTESKGYEFSATANPTSNWRLTLGYSYTDRIQSNTYNRDIIPWYGFKVEGTGLVREGVTQNANGTYVLDPAAFESTGVIAKWVELSQLRPEANLSTLTTDNGNSIAREVFNMINTINEDKRLNEKRWGLRPHRFNVFTAYDFTQGQLKGFSVGGGYRWRSPNIIGTSAKGVEEKGRAITAADLMLRYRRRLAEGRGRGTLVFQVNVMNVFDQGGIIPTHLSSTTDFVIPGGRGIGYSRFALVAPRSVRFTTSYEF